MARYRRSNQSSALLLRLLLCALLTGEAMAGPAAEGAGNFREQVHATLIGYLARYPLIHGEELPALDEWQMLTPPTRIPAGELQVAGMRWDPIQRSLRMRFRCRTANACLPFYVFIPANQRLLRSGGFQMRVRPTPLVRAGQPVRLFTERPGMRLNEAAICLEGGSVGEIVRVRPRGRPWLYARIIAKDVVTLVH